ncbi:AAA family ATPase, partial [Streptomyces sp. MCAF7]
MLIIMGGLPATGKTTLARALARQLDAVHVRVDTIEQAIVRSGLGQHPLGAAGYVVGYALAEDHARQGLT